MMRPSTFVPTGTEMALPVFATRQAAAQAFRRAHRDRAHDAVAELLLHLERQVAVLQLQRVVDLRDRVARKLDVDDGANDLNDLCRCSWLLSLN